MIGKSGTGASFQGLANYLEGENKMEWKEVRNLAGEHKAHYVRMMGDTAGLSRAEKPVYHLSVSYAPADNPPRQQMAADADRLLGELGLAEHQAVIVSHREEHYKHMHLMVNRVDPVTGKAWNPWGDKRKCKDILRRIKADRGYHITSEKNWGNGQGLSRAEYKQLEQHGIEKMPLKAKAEFYELDTLFEEASGWDEVRAGLGEHGLEVRRKGRGGVIAEPATGTTLKLSRVGRAYSLGRLEARFGTYKQFEQVLEATNQLEGKISDRRVRAAFGRLARSQFGGKGGVRKAAEELQKAARSARNLAGTARALQSVATSSNPLATAAKMGAGIIKKAIQSQQDHERGRGR